MNLKGLVIFFFPLGLFAQKSLTVTGNIKGLSNGQRIAIVSLNDAADTVVAGNVVNTKFTMTAKMKEPVFARLVLGSGEDLPLFIYNENITITGDKSNPKNLLIKGSPTNDDFIKYKNKFEPLYNRLNYLNQEIQKGNNSDTIKKAIKSFQTEIQGEIEKFVKENKSSPVSALVLAATAGLVEDYMVTEARYNSLKPSAKSNFLGRYLEEYIAKRKSAGGTEIGGIAPDFSQPDADGKMISLSSFKGKYVLIDFWASWCGPCRRENPNVVAAYNKFKEKNFTVFGVSLDNAAGKEAWLQAVQNDKLTWTQVSDLAGWQNAAAKLYSVTAIPQNFLVDPKGKIIGKNLRGEALEEKLAEVLLVSKK